MIPYDVASTDSNRNDAHADLLVQARVALWLLNQTHKRRCSYGVCVIDRIQLVNITDLG